MRHLPRLSDRGDARRPPDHLQLQGRPRAVKTRGKPCHAGSIAIVAAAWASGPLLCHLAEPDPGDSRRVQSPALSPQATKVTVDVGASPGTLGGTTLVGEAEARKRRADKIGIVVGACYLIGRDAFDYPGDQLEAVVEHLRDSGRWADDSRPAGRLKNCIATAERLIEATATSASASAGAAARGCNTKRIAFESRIRKGKVVGVKVVRSRLSSSSVRYSCSGSGAKAKITVKRSQDLRGAVGKKLDLGVLRAAGAPKRQAALNFAFH